MSALGREELVSPSVAHERVQAANVAIFEAERVLHQRESEARRAWLQLLTVAERGDFANDWSVPGFGPVPRAQQAWAEADNAMRLAQNRLHGARVERIQAEKAWHQALAAATCRHCQEPVRMSQHGWISEEGVDCPAAIEKDLSSRQRIAHIHEVA